MEGQRIYLLHPMTDEEAHIQQLSANVPVFAFRFIVPHIPQTRSPGITQKQVKRPWNHSDQNVCDYLDNK